MANQLYDIYVISGTGVPLFAGCTNTDYCLEHMSQHELISGFLSAMVNFSKESFTETNLESMIYGDIIINFHINEEQDLMFVFIHERECDTTLMRDKLKTASLTFLNNYGDHLQSNIINQSLFSSFRDDLIKVGIIDQSNINDTSKMQQMTEQRKQQKPLLTRWLSKIIPYRNLVS